MADNVTLDPGSGGAVIAADDIGPGVWYQRVKINHGADGSATDVSAASPLPVIGGSNSGVDIGDVTVNNGVGAAAVPIQDGGNSITVDGSVTVSGTVTADLGATDNAVLDDIAAKLGTIDADTSALAGAISGTEVQVDIVSLPAVDTELTTADLDTGGGTDTRAVVGLVGSASGGGALIPGSATDGLLVNLGTNNDVTVTGTVTANLSATDNAVLDTIDAVLDTINAKLVTGTVIGDVNLGATDNAVLDAIAASVAAIDTDATTIIGHVDGLEGLLTTIDADTSTLAAVDFATGADVASLGVTGGGVEATALRVTIASDSTGTLSVDDGGGALTVDGTVTANLSATDNAVLDDIAAKLATIDADTGTLAVVGSGVEATALRVTIASDSTGVLSVDDNGASLTVDNAGLTALNGAIAGTEVQVDVVAALPAGTNAIGKLAANSGVDIGDVDVTSIAAGTNVIGAVREVSGLMIENAVSVTVKYAAIDVASSGDNTIVAAVSGKKIRVLSLFLVAAGTVNVRFENGAGGTALTGQMNLIANTGFVLPHNPHGWFQAGTDNTLLNLELSAAVSVDGALTYIEAE